MGRSVYVASFEGYTGKSTVALGLLEQLSRRVGRIGVFRPVVRADTSEHAGRDYVLDLLVSHDAVTLSYDECAGVTYDDVHRDPTAALDRIVERYHQVADQVRRRRDRGQRLHRRRRADRVLVQRPDRGQPRRPGAARAQRLRAQPRTTCAR